MNVYALRGHERPVRMVKFNEDGDLLFTCSDDGVVAVWRAATAELLGKIKCNSAVKAIDISSDTKYLITAEVAAGFGIYDPLSGKQFAMIPNASQTTARFCEFSFGDKQLVALSEKGSGSEVKVHSLEKALTKGSIVPPIILMDGITQVSWGNLNKTLYVSTQKGSINIFLADNGSSENKRKVHKEAIVSFTFSKDRIFLFTCSRDETYCMLDPDTLEILNTYNFHGNISRAVAISPLYKPNSKPTQRYHILVGGGQDEKEVTTTRKKGGFEIKLVNYITSEELAEIKGHFGPVHSIAFATDGRSFASGSEDGYVRLHYFQMDYYTPKFE